MYLDKLRELKKSSDTRTKTLAEKMHKSERTIGRLLSGETEIGIDELKDMVSIMGGNLDDVLDESDFKLPKPEVEVLRKEIEALTRTIEDLRGSATLLQAETAAARDKIRLLEAENDRLRLTLSHKEELLSLHKFYMERMKD